MNLVFMGTPAFAVPSLERLVRDGHRVVEVVTAPDKPRGRGQKETPTPVAAAAASLGLNVSAPTDLSDTSFIAHLKSLAPDCIVVVAFRILPEAIFGIPPKGIFNLHASLLPKYRGAAPIAWAIIRGERETGVTTFLLERSVDTGRILLQERLTIAEDEVSGDLHDRLAQLGADVVSRTVDALGSGSARPRAQDEGYATTAPKIRKTDCRIAWGSSSADVHNRVRGFSPHPGAWTTLDGKVLKVLRTRIVNEPAGTAEPGTIVRVSQRECIVRCSDGSVALIELMLEGRKRMSTEEFLRGHRMREGQKLGEPTG